MRTISLSKAAQQGVLKGAPITGSESIKLFNYAALGDLEIKCVAAGLVHARQFPQTDKG